MAVQEPKRESSRARNEHEIDEALPTVQASASLSDIDSILEEIDATLEHNAAAFVAAFVQKGGE
ncbi:MAG: ubiquitin-like protein Pup [Actinobacteria bacterium]|nr:MAG: ubiquitin-like protein Pup [Actinomycetota bacterium]